MSFTLPFTRVKHRTYRIIHGPKLPLALGGAIVVSLVLMGVSVAWYTLDGSSKLDLSRPGYEQERAEVRTSETQKSYDTTGAINESAISDFLTEYDTRTKELKGYGDFSDSTLDDNDIQLNVQSGDSSATQ